MNAFSREIQEACSLTSTGALLVSGHVGSFETLGLILAYYVGPYHFIARRFKNPYLDRWWQQERTRSGNTLISREGALKGMLVALRAGKHVALLFDQNVTRNNAVFVDWFGTKAATTAAPALAALRTGCPVFVLSATNTETRRYTLHHQRVETTHIVKDHSLSKEDKIIRITENIVAAFESLLMQQPENWFWMHRRWKTRPLGEPETIYETGSTPESP
jgi:KDO2-lipid IV(A) lauroyltransferase